MGWKLAAGAIALGVGYLALILRMPVGAVEDPVGPRLFPMLVAIGIIVTGAMIGLEGRRAGPVAEPVRDPDFDPAAEAAIVRSQRIGVAGVSVGALLFMLLLEPLGFLLCSILLMLGMLTAFNRGRHLQNVLVAVGVSIVLYVGLRRYLGVPLPGGVLGFLV